MAKKQKFRCAAHTSVLVFQLAFANLQVSAYAATFPRNPRCEVQDVPAAIGPAMAEVEAVLASRRPLRIFAIGSSSTFGVGASSRTQTYPAQLETLLKGALGKDAVDVLNLGVSGETITATIPRMKFEVLRSKPALVLWQLGTNDAIGKMQLPVFENEVQKALQWLRVEMTPVMLVGMQWTPMLASSERYSAFNRSLSQISASQNVPLVLRYESMQAIGARGAIGPLLSNDHFHQSDLGYSCMAEQVAAAFLLRIGKGDVAQ